MDTIRILVGDGAYGDGRRAWNRVSRQWDDEDVTQLQPFGCSCNHIPMDFWRGFFCKLAGSYSRGELFEKFSCNDSSMETFLKLAAV